MLIKLLKAIVNDRMKKHNFKKVVDKTYSDRGFIVDGEVDEFYVDNDRYTITPIKSIADCSKFNICTDYLRHKVYLEEFENRVYNRDREETKTCLIFSIDTDSLEAEEY